MITRDEMIASVSAAIRDGLARNGMTVKDLAYMTSLNRRTIGVILNKNGMPGLYSAYLLSDVLGITLDDMIRYKPEA
jgi:transcriptional regulator with XRE-family HTH domain